MRFQRFGLLAGIAAIGVVTGSVRADTTFFNQPLDAGFAVGTGIPNTNFVGARSTSGLEREVGLGSLLRFTGPTIVPTASANPAIAGVFGNLPPGVSPFPPSPSPFQLAIWNINYSFYAAGGILGDTITPYLDGTRQCPASFHYGSDQHHAKPEGHHSSTGFHKSWVFRASSFLVRPQPRRTLLCQFNTFRRRLCNHPDHDG